MLSEHRTLRTLGKSGHSPRAQDFIRGVCLSTGYAEGNLRRRRRETRRDRRDAALLRAPRSFHVKGRGQVKVEDCERPPRLPHSFRYGFFLAFDYGLSASCFALMLCSSSFGSSSNDEQETGGSEGRVKAASCGRVSRPQAGPNASRLQVNRHRFQRLVAVKPWSRLPARHTHSQQQPDFIIVGGSSQGRKLRSSLSTASRTQRITPPSQQAQVSTPRRGEAVVAPTGASHSLTTTTNT